MIMDRGFVIMAQGDIYLDCAEVLKTNINKIMPNEQVTIITSEMLPFGDQCKNSNWKLQNDWQVYTSTPYEYTIKLEADMCLPRSIEHWWDILKDHDIIVSSTIRNFKQEISTSRVYRQFIDDNNLPDVYNGIMYFKKSKIAEQFFATVRNIFENWDEYKKILICNKNEMATTDWVYAIACHIIGIENTTLPKFTDMSMIHMKQFINGLPTENWTDTLIYEILDHSLRINTVPQLYPFHYHIKNFHKKLKEIEND